jgi:hypothetical protein
MDNKPVLSLKMETLLPHKSEIPLFTKELEYLSCSLFPIVPILTMLISPSLNSCKYLKQLNYTLITLLYQRINYL